MTKQHLHTLECDFMTNGHWFRLVTSWDKVNQDYVNLVYSKKSCGQLILVDNDNLPQKIHDNVQKLAHSIIEANLNLFRGKV